jgi:hemin uptake protein HemP
MGHRKHFQLYFKDLISKTRDLNNFKANLNRIQNRINSNELFGNLSNLDIWNLV